MRKKRIDMVFFILTKLIEVLFPAMILSFALPLFYLTSGGRADSFMLPLYLAGFVLVIPAAFGRYALYRVKGLLLWMLVCAALIAAVYAAASLVSRFLPWETAFRAAAAAAARAEEKGNFFAVSPAVYRICSSVEAAVILFDFYLVRMQEAGRLRAVRENDMTWSGRTYLFEAPAPYVLIWFALCYVMGLLFACPAVSDIAAAVFAVYAVMYLFYRFARDTSYYLKRLDYLSNMPSKRIRTIGIIMLAVCLLVCAGAAGLAGKFTKGVRQYGDLRNWEGLGPVNMEEFQNYAQMSGPDALFVPPDEIAPTEPWKYGFIFEYLAGALLAVVALIGIRAAFRMTKEIFDEFRDIEDENGDISVSLENGDRAQRLFSRVRKRTPDTPRERIRREYRRAIRKARKEIPNEYETPSEIEELAGLSGDPAMQDLHVRYEEARYGE